MSCASCASSIEEAISNVAGVAECNVNFGAEQAAIEYNPRQTDADRRQSKNCRSDRPSSWYS